jgi:hypothetical protein
MNKKAFGIADTLILVGVGLLFLVTIFSFNSTNVKVRNSFAGIGKVERLSAKIEENIFYEQNKILEEINLDEQVETQEETEQTETNLIVKEDNQVFLNAIKYAQENSPVVDRHFKCGSSCEEYANLIQTYSKKYNVDPVLVLSLIMQESDGILSAGSGSSLGLMQVNANNCGSYGLPLNSSECRSLLLTNAEKNIEVGIMILIEKYNLFPEGKLFQGCSNRNILYEGWEAALRGYNGWGCGCDTSIKNVILKDRCSVTNEETGKIVYGKKIYSQDNYVEEVIRRYGILKGIYEENLETKKILFQKDYEISFSVKYLGKP